MAVYKALHQYAWERNDSAVIPYLKAKKANDRALAAEILGSMFSKESIPYLSQSVQSDQDAEVRRMAAFALGQLRDSSAVPSLLIAVRSEVEELVRTELFRALGRCANQDVWNMIRTFNPKSDELKTAWMDCLFQAAMASEPALASDSTILWKSIQNANRDSMYAVYWAHYIKRLRTNWLNEQKDVIRNASKRITGDANLLYHIGVATGDSTVKSTKKPVNNSPYDMASVNGNWKDASHPYVRNQLVESQLNEVKNDSGHLKEIVLELMQTKDMAVISLGCYQILAHPTWFQDSGIVEALEFNLSWANKTEYTETYLDIKKALEALGKTVGQNDAPVYFPLDWSYWDALDSVEIVVVKTDVGDIRCETYPYHAPATVVRFLQSVDSDIYSNRYFHRVVPHFVIQGGCPRGDGWGSEPWMLRSYFTPELSYSPGAMGLASVGPDTEGVQFFITHEHTPHLDGRYTIFGQVIEGMAVVRKIRPGNQIISIDRK